MSKKKKERTKKRSLINDANIVAKAQNISRKQHSSLVAMPARKQPQRLEQLCQESLGGIFAGSCQRIADSFVGRASFNDDDGGGGSGCPARVEDAADLRRVIKLMQEAFLVGTAHYFHKDILRECMVRT